MADIDFKKIGLAAKDLVFGIGTVAAGATGGPAAAEGVSKAGSGLDSILGMAGVTETRGDKFDRADFTARPQPVLSGPPAKQPSVEMAKPESPRPPELARTISGGALPSPSREEDSLTGDAGMAAEHLRSLGWSRDRIQQILRGPDLTSSTALVDGAPDAEAEDTNTGIVHGALQEAGWHPEARQAILRGPYAFADYMKPRRHVPTEQEMARFARHNVDALMQERLHHATERGGHCPQLYHGTDDAQWARIGEDTEHPRTKE